MRKEFGSFPLLFLAFFTLSFSGCASFRPLPFDEAPYLYQAVTKSDEDLRVSVNVLTPEKSTETFGVDLAGKGLQPIWIKIENRGTNHYRFVPHRLDPEYYPPLEVANILFGSRSVEDNKIIHDHFYDVRMPRFIPPGTARSGFVFTRFEQGMKHLAIKIIGNNSVKRFYFAVELPGPEMDFQRVDFNRLYRPEEEITLDLPGLRRALESLPCCTTDIKGSLPGDPLNLVIIGDRMLVMSELLSRGWNLAETIRGVSVLKTIWSSLFGVRYPTAPVSPLYFMGRHQDFAMQKTRSTINRRNHLRLWLSPMTIEGKPVWIGQISRDIGVKLTTKSPYLVVHEISSNIDEARHFLMEDLLGSHAVEKIGHVKASEPVLRSAPQRNITDDEYFTDGYRLVIFLRDKHIPFNEIIWLDWENPE